MAVAALDAEESFLDAGGAIRGGWKTAIGSMVCLAMGPSVICSMSFGVYVPYLRDAFGWSVSDVGFGVSIMAITVVVTSVLSGLLIDRFGVRRVVLTCIPIFGLGYAAMGLQSGQLWQFYLAWFAMPLISIGLWPNAWAKATAGWFRRRLGLAVAIATTGVGIGAAIMPLAVNGIAGHFGWRAAYGTIGIGAIVIAFPVAWFWVREAPRGPERAPERPAGEPQSMKAVARDGRFILLCTGFLALGMFSSIVLVNLVSLLEVNGMTRQNAVFAQSVVGLSTVGGRLLCGWLLDRYPFRAIVPVYCLAAAVAVAVFASGAGGGLALLAAAVTGLMIGAEIDLLGFAIQRLFGRASYATIFGVIFAAFHIGGAVGAISTGALHQATGAFTSALLLASGACVVAAVLFSRVPIAVVRAAH